MKKFGVDEVNWSENRKVANNVFWLIGRTPIVKLDRILGKDGVTAAVLAKLEFFNPTGSLKDRIYHKMITKAIENGKLKPGMEILEASTGNAGISCTFVGRCLGYGVTVVMPRGMSQERVKFIRALGGKLIFTEGGESDVDLSMKTVKEMMKENPGRYWWPEQFSNPDNSLAHYETTGPEIWKQTDGKIDCFLAAAGTGGTLTGVGRYLKEKDPNIRIYAVEPSEAPLLSKRHWGSHRIEGIGDGFVPRNLDLSLLTGVITTTSEEAIEMARRLASEEGIFCGISSGCNVTAAIKIAKIHPEFKSIVTMINDSGERYFSTELCGEEKHLEVPVREHPMDEYTVEELDKHEAKWEIIE